MRDPVRLAMCAGLALVFVCGAFAQGGGPGGVAVQSTAVRQGTITVSGPMIGGGLAMMGVPVTGAPYSAQETSEHTQTLADGTHIVQRPRTTLVFRDSQGRTRTERPIIVGPNADANGPTLIQIRDPVAGFLYTLDTQNHVAHRVAMAQRGGTGGPETVMTAGMAQAAISAVPPPPPPPPPPLQTASASGVSATPMNRIERSSEDLGTQVMEGVTVVGHRVTMTVPVGAQGNDRPLVSTTETWRSPELNVIVLSKNSDPRNGENIMKLTNINVGEPDAALFQPPPDYTIVDDAGSSTIRFTVPR